ncbi:DUF362 domain-containing protein [Desulforhopalus singaporensis]|uniref:Uncharacterized conserved protein, DUF362 family n=1 Tax=Desulforhopalus singaporensis TaxID=91360 RepID=A0A1H0J7U0_9BACT|nr:DUF362 domain-containing protein [Desulforhopalus singaporensis]SDO39549.1 Uncharacterized conserved protein, DUF362 family [Desulforhopalus singaporensis]
MLARQERKNIVALEHCRGYRRDEVKALVEGMSVRLGLHNLHGRTVLLKPNFISSRGPRLACTHAEVVVGTAGWFIDNGARVLVGDSPAFGSVGRVCQHLGMKAGLAAMGVECVEFTTPVKKLLSCGTEVTVAAEPLDCDLLVGLPKVKAHDQLYVTLAVKNLFGIVKGMHKAMLHMTRGTSHDRFAELILGLVDLVPDQVHFIDGVTVMHRSGPLHGDPLSLHLFGGARNPVCLDNALLDVLELNPEMSPLWRAANRQKKVATVSADIKYTGRRPEEFHGSGFVPPTALDAIRFNPFRFFRGMVKRAVFRAGG